jgi:hypothetical protein
VARVPRRDTDTDRLQLIEFEGKYDILLPAELSELADDQLVALIMERGNVEESRAREVLATIRRWGAGTVGRGYDRI